MHRLAFAIAAALAAGPAAAQPADDTIGQLLNAPTQTTEPASTVTVPAAEAPPVPAPGAGAALAAPTPAPAATAAPGETISTAAPAQAPTQPPPALTTATPPPSAVAAGPTPVPATNPSASAPIEPALAATQPSPVAPPPTALAASAPAQATAASVDVSPAQAAALQAAVMAPRLGASVAAAAKGPSAPSPAYSTLSSVTRPTGARTAASSLTSPAPAGDADEDAAPAQQGDTYSNWSDPSQRPGARPAYGRYGVARPTYSASNPGLPYTRYSQVTRPVQLAETGVSADQPMTSQDLAYEGRMRQAFSAAENAQGPMDGHWVLMGPEGRLYGFQVVDRGQTLEGVWTDLRRPPGSLETAGLIEQLSRDGDSLTVRFTAPRGGGPVTLTLRSAPGGTWAGQMSGAASQVTLRRD